MNVERPRVVIESPYAGDIKANTLYFWECVKHSILLGEAPFGSHGFYTKVLDERTERDHGIELGYNWLIGANKQVLYLDRGLSKGMLQAVEFAWAIDLPTEARWLYGPVDKSLIPAFIRARVTALQSFEYQKCA